MIIKKSSIPIAHKKVMLIFYSQVSKGAGWREGVEQGSSFLLWGLEESNVSNILFKGVRFYKPGLLLPSL